MIARASLCIALLALSMPASGASFPRFATFGWLSPPPEFTDSTHVGDYVDTGMNVLLPAWRDSGLAADTRARMRLAHARGAMCIAWDRRLRQVDPTNPSTFAAIDSVVTMFRDDPGFLAYYLGDEPDASRLPLIAGFFALLAGRDPAHPGWNNLSGRSSFTSQADFLASLRRYVAVVHPTVLCADHYDLLADHDLGLAVANAQGLAQVARESGLPFWGIVLGTGHRPFREPTEGEMRWQIATLLAYGAHGIGWFTYWTPDFDARYEWQPALVDTAGQRTARHALARRVLGDTRAVGNELAGTAWRRTQFASAAPEGGDPFVPDDRVTGVEGRICLATFEDSLGRDVRFVANSDSLGAQPITLLLARGRVRRVETFDPETALWSESPLCDSSATPALRFALAPGEFTLVRLTPRSHSPGPGRATLEAWPNPARGTVTFSARGCAPGTRLVVRDARGRRVRGLAVPADGAPVAWRGEHDDGGHAAPGVYFARLGERPGAVACRFVWSP